MGNLTSGIQPAYSTQELLEKVVGRLGALHIPNKWHHFVKAKLSLISQGIEFLESY